MKPYGLILAGGGAKGAYQIGAWKAMRELDIEFEAIAGGLNRRYKRSYDSSRGF